MFCLASQTMYVYTMSVALGGSSSMVNPTLRDTTVVEVGKKHYHSTIPKCLVLHGCDHADNIAMGGGINTTTGPESKA